MLPVAPNRSTNTRPRTTHAPQLPYRFPNQGPPI
jgi:hypothetical protein